ncbi:MAG: hypothetical protein M3R17_08425 [Bacteroidota bacterium]|nr:hypothetical protein [Bacteroidota bacterium]
MKNKKTAYILVPIVLAIWGIIGWKVYAAMGGKDESNIVAISENVNVSKIDIPDTIELIANYRDPFLDDLKFEIRNSKLNIRDSKSVKVEIPVLPKVIVSWPAIAYFGLIKRNSDGKTVGFLSVNGVSYFVQGGEGAGEVKVSKLWKDSVEVVWGKERRVVKK